VNLRRRIDDGGVSSTSAEPVRTVLREFLARRISGPVAIARLLFRAEAPERLREILRAHRVAIEISNGGDARRLEELDELLKTHGGGAARVQELIRGHERALSRGRRGESLEAWRSFFDESVHTSLEGSVAAYSLGSAELLAEGTAEIVSLLESGGLLPRSAPVLEIGCGIGRFAEALAPRVSRYHGTDISIGMLAAARRRCARLPNVGFSQTSGRDLAALRASSVGLVLAVDSFPYIHHAGEALVDAHFAEARRVLKKGGRLVVLNYSYDGDFDGERVEVATRAGAHGFLLEVGGVYPFKLWDGVLYQMKK